VCPRVVAQSKREWKQQSPGPNVAQFAENNKIKSSFTNFSCGIFTDQEEALQAHVIRNGDD
jgi:hypothetical protein